jgi:hypothetical protein
MSILIMLLVMISLIISIISLVIGMDSKGAKGEKGEKGLSGEGIGIPGPSGKNGIDGAKGAQGERGPSGVNGATGFNGAQGIMGPPGPQGIPGNGFTTIKDPTEFCIDKVCITQEQLKILTGATAINIENKDATAKKYLAQQSNGFDATYNGKPTDKYTGHYIKVQATSNSTGSKFGTEVNAP